MTTVHEVLRRVPNPRALRAAVADPRRAGRALSCKTRASTRWHRVRHKLARVHALARVYALARVHARLAASSLTRSTKATTGLARTHGQIVMGTGAHMRGMRTTRKSWTDASARRVPLASSPTRAGGMAGNCDAGGQFAAGCVGVAGAPGAPGRVSRRCGEHDLGSLRPHMNTNDPRS